MSASAGNNNSGASASAAVAANKQRVQVLSELANVHEASEAYEKMQIVLQEARNLQRELLQRARVSASSSTGAAAAGGGSGDDEKQQLAKLCVKLGHALLLDGGMNIISLVMCYRHFLFVCCHYLSFCVESLLYLYMFVCLTARKHKYA